MEKEIRLWHKIAFWGLGSFIVSGTVSIFVLPAYMFWYVGAREVLHYTNGLNGFWSYVVCQLFVIFIFWLSYVVLGDKDTVNSSLARIKH